MGDIPAVVAVLLAAAGSLATWVLGRISAHLDHRYEMDRRRLDREEAQADRAIEQSERARSESLEWVVRLKLLVKYEAFEAEEGRAGLDNPYVVEPDAPGQPNEYLDRVMVAEVDPRLSDEARAAAEQLHTRLTDWGAFAGYDPDPHRWADMAGKIDDALDRLIAALQDMG